MRPPQWIAFPSRKAEEVDAVELERGGPRAH